MPLQATSGAASYDAFGGGVAAVPQYIEDVFGTFLYTGNGSTQTITNGIDLSGKGGLVWIKWRSSVYGSVDHNLYDTSRGVLNRIYSNLTAAQTNQASSLTAFNSDGFSLGGTSGTNGSGATYASWTFRKQPKFFDVVTWSGNGTIGRTISHSLGSVPGCIIVKRTNGVGDWVVYHRSLGATKAMLLNLTDSVYTWNVWNDTAPTSTVFSLNDASEVNGAGNTYVAYVLAHDAGGFGLTGTDNVISCGSFTVDGSGDCSVSLGYEPQWIMVKSSTATDNWYLFDNMRGFPVAPADGELLRPNTSGAGITNSTFRPTSTGFIGSPGTLFGTGIYIAIRRGPMKVPTSGTSVFSPVAQTIGTGSLVTTGFVTDAGISRPLSSSTGGLVESRLTGNGYMQSSNTDAESAGSASWAYMNGYSPIPWTGSGLSSIAWTFRRAPSFFDEVCYTGTGVANTAFTHNLTVTPELMIVKPRSAATAPNWRVWSPINSTDFNLLQLSTDGAASSSLYSSSNVFPAIPTATTFTVGGSGSIQLNESGQTFVAYLFATCAGVSKCFNYTGNGSSQTINCGFTAGARWILIKRTDSTGDWYVWDSARGIVSGNDPHLSLNSTAAEVTTDDTIDTDSTGFVVNQVSATNVNVSSATYIGLAIA